MKLFTTALVLGCMSASSAFAGYEGGQFGANRWPNWYVGVSGTLPFVSSTDVNVGGARAGEVDFDGGYGVGLALGYTPGPNGNFLDNMRFELEYMYRGNDLDTISNAGGSSALSDDLTSDTYMVNAYYDINTGTRLTPYIGAGAGMTNVELSVPTLALDDTDNVFAYQVMAGLGWQPEALLNTSLHLGYRFMDASDPEFTTRTGTRVEHEYQVHGVEAGARFRF
jgi:opacity protein-like surface antigen